MSETKSLAIIPRGIDEAMSLAVELSKATTVSPEFRDKPANVLAAIMAGAELNFPPMAALRSVHIIKGIPKLTADAMVAVVLASGKALYFEPSVMSATSVTFVTKRVGSTREQSCTWSIEDAKRAGLTSDNHRLYPRQMLAARAKSELARSIYPDLCAGLYTEEEVPSGAYAQTLQPEAIDAEIVEPGSEMIAEINGAETAEALSALAPKINKLAKGSAERIASTAAFKAKQGTFMPPVSNGVSHEAATAP
jgi:hypothetical protein